jgi:uncharacterized protein
MPEQVVLITGASSGIGRAVAEAFAHQGAKLVLSGRRQDRLDSLRERLHGVDVTVVPADLADPSSAQPLVASTLDAYGRLDVLVNNAGFGTQARFEEMTEQDVAKMFAVNVLSPMALARAAVSTMRRQGAGSIVNVASVGGVVAHPLNVAYCASKHALVGFSKSLRLELSGTGIRVVAVCPGATKTEFFEVAKRDIPFDDIVDRFMAPPEVVAATIVRAVSSDRAVLFPTWAAWFLYAADRVVPRLSAAGNVRYRDKVLGRVRPKEV